MSNTRDKFETESTDYFSTLKDYEFREVVCPLCYRSERTPMFEKDTMRVVRCVCGMVYNRRQPGINALDKFYQESDAMKEWAKIKSSDAEKFRQKKKFQPIAEMLKDKKSFMDIGCGTGTFLYWVKKENPEAEVSGIDSHEGSVAVAKAMGIDAKWQGILDFFREDERTFDVVSLWGVLEHYPTPKSLLHHCKLALNKDGYIVVCVPNMDSLVVETLRQHTFTFCPQHLWYFDKSSLERLAWEVGLELTSYRTIEPEVDPIVRWRLGYDPYDRSVNTSGYSKMAEVEHEAKSRGYKIVACFKKKKVQALCTNYSESWKQVYPQQKPTDPGPKDDH